MRFDKYKISLAIKENLKQMGYFRTTDIQYKTIPAIMKGEDVLAIAQTGTGKTAAFAIPIVNQIHEQKMKHSVQGVSCLVLVPTRELAGQIGKIFSSLTKNTRANSYAIYGGVDQDPQIEQLVSGIDIIVATPGRVFDLIHQGYIDIRNLKTLVLDEADHMLDLGFITDIKSIKSKLLKKHQTLFFSATINPEIKKLAYSQIKSNALRIQVSPENMVSKNVSHYLVNVKMDEKRFLLKSFLDTNPESKVLLFVRTQVRAERVESFLLKNSYSVLCLHGGKDQNHREDVLESFREQSKGVLVATDVSARGIDLPGITHVINYDIPDDPENYIHRVGRTGRAFAKGDAISFCSPEEEAKKVAIEELIKMEIPVIEIEENLFATTPPVEIEDMSVTDILAMEEKNYERPKKKKNRSKKSK